MLGSLKYLISAALFGLLLAGGSLPAEAKSIIYLIRHAEKVDDGTRDPSLNEAGRARAEWLADWFAGRGITAIYSSEFKRTLETVAPLSVRLNMPIAPYDPRALEDVVTRLRAAEGVIVVSGHGNTTPALVNMLIGEDRYADLAEGWMYDHIFQVMLGDDGAVAVEILYSEPRSTEPPGD
ncbi:MAG: histidine phosphatase family protein [Proteobacteria bacterium]|nr:histidine phosphatase family protein [Pseudomonadota bacterium]